VGRKERIEPKSRKLRRPISVPKQIIKFKLAKRKKGGGFIMNHFQNSKDWRERHPFFVFIDCQLSFESSQ
jgi:hypothetical protein